MNLSRSERKLMCQFLTSVGIDPNRVPYDEEALEVTRVNAVNTLVKWREYERLTVYPPTLTEWKELVTELEPPFEYPTAASSVLNTSGAKELE